jgi:hypothetical protein
MAPRKKGSLDEYRQPNNIKAKYVPKKEPPLNRKYSNKKLHQAAQRAAKNLIHVHKVRWGILNVSERDLEHWVSAIYDGLVEEGESK